MRWQGVVFGLACAVWILLLPVAVILAPLLSHAGAEGGTPLVMLNFLTLPVACLIAPLAAWIARKKGQRRLSWALVAAPLLWLILPALMMAAH